MGLIGNIANKFEGVSRIGNKVLGGANRIGHKVASGIRNVAGAVNKVPILGAVSNMPIIKGMSAQQLASGAAAGIDKVADMAGSANQALQSGSNLVRAGRELGAANTFGEKLQAAKDVARLGRQIQRNM